MAAQYIFQMQGLSKTYPGGKKVFENIWLSLEGSRSVWSTLFSRITPAQRDRIHEVLNTVGLSDKVGELPGRLSGGQQQRVAIAPAIAHQPRVLLADEPTGNVDSPTSAEIMELFADLNGMGSTVIMATHDEWVLASFPAPTLSIELPPPPVRKAS